MNRRSKFLQRSSLSSKSYPFYIRDLHSQSKPDTFLHFLSPSENAYWPHSNTSLLHTMSLLQPTHYSHKPYIPYVSPSIAISQFLTNTSFVLLYTYQQPVEPKASSLLAFRSYIYPAAPTYSIPQYSGDSNTPFADTDNIQYNYSLFPLLLMYISCGRRVTMSWIFLLGGRSGMVVEGCVLMGLDDGYGYG